MKILLLDIETSPNLVHRWSLFGQDNTSLAQLMESSQMICWVAKWYRDPNPIFRKTMATGETKTTKKSAGAQASDPARGVSDLWNLLDEADVVITYNGDRFDLPIIRGEFLRAGLKPPAPFQSLDLLKAAKRQFKFPSMKLQYLSEDVLGLTGKVSHEGHGLWVKCLQGDKDAWAKMEEYNIQDVVLLEEVYDKLLPWILNHPNVNLYDEQDEFTEPLCPTCGELDYQKRGFKYTGLGKFQRYNCNACGSWFAGTKRLQGGTFNNGKS